MDRQSRLGVGIKVAAADDVHEVWFRTLKSPHSRILLSEHPHERVVGGVE